MSPVNNLTTKQTAAFLAHLRETMVSAKYSYRSTRNMLIAVLMLDTGIRVGELVALTWDSLMLAGTAAATLEISAEAAKTGKARSVPLSTRSRQLIDAFYGSQSHVVPEAPFPLSPRGIQQMIAAVGLKACNTRVTPHMLRHTFATRLLACSNTAVVQKLLGHVALSSTQVYVHPSAADATNAIAAMETS